jgi:hypothetical protein
MSASRVWRRNKITSKKTRPGYKLKIRWEQFGLTDPESDHAETSIDTIRRGVSAMASEGLSQDTRARTEAHNSKSSRPSRRTAQKPALRPGKSK